MRHIDDQSWVAEGRTTVSSSEMAESLTRCQVYLQVEHMTNPKNAFWTQKGFYGGCMTGRSRTPTSRDMSERALAP